MDNLSSHHNVQLSLLICMAGHRLILGAPYDPINGPIEYMFNTIQGTFRINMASIVDGPPLVDKGVAAIVDIQTFDPYFVNCWYWIN